MPQQTFPVEKEPRIVINQVIGDLTVHSWHEEGIRVNIDHRAADLRQEGNTLMIVDCDSDIELNVPPDTSIVLTNGRGDVEIVGVRLVKLDTVAGDVTLKDISGDAELENVGAAIELHNLGGDLNVVNSPILRVRHSVGGDATLRDVGIAEIETVGGDLSLAHVDTIVVSTIGGDLGADRVGVSLRCGTVGGDCHVQSSAQVEVIVGYCCDCVVSSAATVHLGNISGDCQVRDVQGDAEIGYIGGDADVKSVGGHVKLGNIGGDASLKGIKGSLEASNVGGDIEAQAAFPPDSYTRFTVGGDARIILPEKPDLAIRAVVGGDISGHAIIANKRGNLINLLYGNGAAHLDLNVGGDLALRTSASPQSASSAGDEWNEFGPGMSGPWSEFGREMSKFGREMGKFGQELGREIAAAFNEAGWEHGASIADDLASKAEEQVRHAQQKAEEAARRASEKAAHVHIRFNDREWRMDPQRLERIRDQSRRAASEGISGAFDAVERAMSNLRVPTSPRPPTPPTPPAAPSQADRERSAPPVPLTPGDTDINVDPNKTRSARPAQAQAQASNLNIDQEREAILRMIAEGRVTPEEGDMLLEALGS